MLKAQAAFSGVSVDDESGAKQFYAKTLGLKLTDESMGLRFDLPGGGSLFVYQKDNHEPATFTVLNFVVDDIDAAVEELAAGGVEFEQYEGMTDDKGIARGIAASRGPDIAWFKDPAGNILSVLMEPKTK